VALRAAEKIINLKNCKNSKIGKKLNGKIMKRFEEFAQFWQNILPYKNWSK